MNLFALTSFIFSLISGTPSAEKGLDAAGDAKIDCPNICIEETVEQQENSETT